MKRYEEAMDYIESGVTTYGGILEEIKDIATDKDLKNAMIKEAGNLEAYAREIYETVEELLNDGNA